MRAVGVQSALLATGIAAAFIAATPARAVPPKHEKAISGRVDIGGRELFLECTGSGRPTVVMDAGLGGGHNAWAAIAPAVSKLTRTCTYDRIGEGFSDWARRPRTSSDIVSDLSLLLKRARVVPPYLLVGHSFGGLNVRLFAGEHPRDVAGLVLVDATTTTLLDDVCAISASLCREFRSGWTNNPEAVRFDPSARQVEATRLPRIPLLVLIATDHTVPNQPARVNRRFEAVWRRRQQRIAASVPGGRFELVKGGHGIPDEHPGVVIAAIRSVLKKARS